VHFRMFAVDVRRRAVPLNALSVASADRTRPKKPALSRAG
jgi:hypothetical protein